MKDYLWLHLRDLPYFRSLVRANEALFYQGLPLPRPVLDVGSGDGHFASVAFAAPLDVGIDPWSGPVRKSHRLGVYRLVVQGDAAQMPFPDGHFASALSNSVLEHVPGVEAVLAETARVLKPGAPFYFCVPNHQFLNSLSLARLFDRLGLLSMAVAYRRFFNRISRHHHSDAPQVWERRLSQAGMVMESWFHYIPPSGLRVVEWGHYFGLPSLLSHALTRRWVLVPQPWNLFFTRRLVEPHVGANAISPAGVYTFFTARKAGGS